MNLKSGVCTLLRDHYHFVTARGSHKSHVTAPVDSAFLSKPDLHATNTFYYYVQHKVPFISCSNNLLHSWLCGIWDYSAGVYTTLSKESQTCVKGGERERVEVVQETGSVHRGTQCSWHMSHLCGLGLTGCTWNKNQVICDADCCVVLFCHLRYTEFSVCMC